MQLSEQELVRRANLEKIRALRFDPYPANQFEVNFTSTDFTTAEYQMNLDKKLTEIKGVNLVQAAKLRELLLKNRGKSANLLADEALVTELNISEMVVFEDPAQQKDISLEDYFAASKEAALGAFSADELGVIQIAGRFMGQRGPFAKLQDAHGRIQLYIGKNALGESDEDKDRYKKLVKLLDIGDYIGIKGTVFATGTGEVTIKVEALTLLSKALRPLPVVKTKVNEETGETEVYDAFVDPELRYRIR